MICSNGTSGCRPVPPSLLHGATMQAVSASCAGVASVPHCTGVPSPLPSPRGRSKYPPPVLEETRTSSSSRRRSVGSSARGAGDATAPTRSSMGTSNTSRPTRRRSSAAWASTRRAASGRGWRGATAAAAGARRPGTRRRVGDEGQEDGASDPSPRGRPAGLHRLLLRRPAGARDGLRAEFPGATTRIPDGDMAGHLEGSGWRRQRTRDRRRYLGPGGAVQEEVFGEDGFVYDLLVVPPPAKKKGDSDAEPLAEKGA